MDDKNLNKIEKLSENEVEEISGGFAGGLGFMEKFDRKCKICGNTWTEFHPSGSEWMTESICKSCWEKRRLKESEQKDGKNAQDPLAF